MLRIGSIVPRVDDLQRQTESGNRHSATCVATATSCCFARRTAPGPICHSTEFGRPCRSLPRLHLDLYTENQAEEVERLLSLGATEVYWDKRPSDADYVILADPEGNRFCVVDTSR